MEDVLDVYQREYDENQPVVCLDETHKQLIEETRLPAKPGQVEKVDDEYTRNGVANVFMISEPLAGFRDPVIKETRTALDFAHVLQHVSDPLYPDVEKIVLIMDHLNTHTLASLYKAFEPIEARRIATRFELHFTPKHGSWLNMAEIEIGVMCRQALSKPLSNLELFSEQVQAWTANRHTETSKINWQFTNAEARIKLKKLYPVIV